MSPKSSRGSIPFSHGVVHDFESPSTLSVYNFSVDPLTHHVFHHTPRELVITHTEAIASSGILHFPARSRSAVLQPVEGQISPKTPSSRTQPASPDLPTTRRVVRRIDFHLIYHCSLTCDLATDTRRHEQRAVGTRNGETRSDGRRRTSRSIPT